MATDTRIREEVRVPGLVADVDDGRVVDLEELLAGDAGREVVAWARGGAGVAAAAVARTDVLAEDDDEVADWRVVGDAADAGGGTAAALKAAGYCERR